MSDLTASWLMRGYKGDEPYSEDPSFEGSDDPGDDSDGDTAGRSWRMRQLDMLTGPQADPDE